MSIELNFFRQADNADEYAAGAVIFEKGDEAEVMYGVQEGTVEIYFGDRLLETIKPGGIFGEMALADKQPRSAQAVAKTDCKLVPIDQFRFTFLVEHHPMFALYVLQTMARRLRRETD